MTNDNQHIPSGYKPSPLGIIPEDWEVKRLGDVCTFHNGRAYNQKELLSQGKYRVLRVGNFFTNNSWYYSDLELEEDKYANDGDLLYAWSASFGPRFWNGEKIIYHYHIWKIDSFINVYNSYLFSFLFFDASKLTNTLQGGTMVHVTKENMEKRYIPLPPLSEQQRIVSVLSLWDTAIEKQTALIEQLTLRKRGLMQQLLTGKKRLKGFSGEWKEVRLGEICPMERGEMLTSDNYLQGNIPVIAGGKEPAGFHSYANRQKNTITISCSGASAGFVAFHDVPIFATDCFTISESNAYNVWFIYHVLTNLQEKIYKLQTGGAQPHVHPKDVYPMKIHIPSIKEQNVIASVLVNADKEIDTQKQKLAALQAQKKGLMQVLLTGKKRIITTKH